MARAVNGLPQVVISANGTNTQTKRLRRQSTSKDIATSYSLNGINAAPALDGENGKRVKIELIPSHGGGFNATGVIGEKSWITHVEKGFDLFVNSRGSDGEDGGRGGDGKQGRRGYDGKDATEHSDAKQGGDGGRGGDGGLGSNGGNGGDGGNINILTSESNMHLIVAVDWSVRAGKGGRAGEHGRPGNGGVGGKGGSGYSWKEVTSHKWKCVDHGSMALTSSAGRGSAPLTSANLAALGQLQTGRDLSFSFPQGGYISDGTNVAQVSHLQGTIPANMAPQFQRALLGSGNELTRGGQLGTTVGHAPGCQLKPIYTTYHKPGASNGNKGHSGYIPTGVLTPGRDGSDGTAAILVQNDDGTVSTYSSKFEFQLLDFEVVDENDDGIFEPGECVIIKNIRIKNTGGMPSPKRTKIPLRMQPSSWITAVSGKDVIFLPLDIPPGSTKTTTHEIWAKIRSPHAQPDSTPFEMVSTIKLEATIPDLDRHVPHFEYSQNITIQYPVKLVTDEIKWMDTIPQGSSTSLQWVVMNISSKELGYNSKSQRNIMTKISCPPTSTAILGDRLSASSESERTCRRHKFGLLQQDMSSQVSESLCIPKDMPEYTIIDFLIELLITPASTQQSQRSLDLITLQTFSLSVQVSKTWQYNSSSEFLLLTSKSTTKDTVDSWSQFIQKHLNMSIDVWNISLYGGLDTEATRKSVLDSYVGKTILALDDDLFQYFDQGQRSILDFIDPTEGSTLSRNGTRVVSVQRKAESRHEREEKNIEHVAHAAVLENPHLTANELHQLENTDELISQLHQLRENPSNSVQNEQYFIPFNSSNLKGKGKKIAKRLTKEFPLDNFIVTDSADGLGVRITHCGAHGEGYSTAQVAQTSNGVGRSEEFCGLNPAEAYSCVSALPLKARLDILLVSQKGTGNFQYSEFIQKAALNSVKTELYDQVQAMAKRPRWRDGLFSGPEKISTNSLFHSDNDKITTVLSHEIMVDVASSIDDLSSPASQILHSIIQSAQCQNTQQLLIKLFSPFKRTRSHVRQSLMKNVLDVIASSGQNSDPNPKPPEERIKTFKRKASMRLRYKNYQADINTGIQNITHDAIRDVKQSLTSIEEVMPKSVYKSPDELVTKAKSYEKAGMQRKRDTMQHREWKQELGLEISETGSVGNEIDLEGFDSSELASNSVYDQSMVSNVSEASTVLTLPEMDGKSPLRIEKSQWKTGGVEFLAEMDEKSPSRPKVEKSEWKINEVKYLPEMKGKSSPRSRIEKAHKMPQNTSEVESLLPEMGEKSPSWLESHEPQWNISGINSLPEMDNNPRSKIPKPHELHSTASKPNPPSETVEKIPWIPTPSSLPKANSNNSSNPQEQHKLHSISEPKSLPVIDNKVDFPSKKGKTHEFRWEISEVDSPLTPQSKDNVNQAWENTEEESWGFSPASPSPFSEDVGEMQKSSELQSPVTPSPLYFPPISGDLGADRSVGIGKGDGDLFGVHGNIQRTKSAVEDGSEEFEIRDVGAGNGDLDNGPVWFNYDEDELKFN